MFSVDTSKVVEWNQFLREVFPDAPTSHLKTLEQYFIEEMHAYLPALIYCEEVMDKFLSLVPTSLLDLNERDALREAFIKQIKADEAAEKAKQKK